MKKIFVFIIIIFSSKIYAQQDAIYSQYLFNKLQINPAYAGSAERLSLTALYRNQWAKINGAPQDISFSVHAPLKNDKLGLGGTVLNDKIGPYSNLTTNLSFSYKIPIRKVQLRFGMQAGLNYYNINYAVLRGYQIKDDPFIGDIKNIFKPLFGAGVYAQAKSWAVGFSVPNILGGKFDFTNSQNTPKKEIHYFLTAEYVAAISKSFKLKPATCIHYAKGSPVNLDANLNLIYKNMIWLGGGYRTDNSGIISAQFVMDKLIKKSKHTYKIGYAYDFANSKIIQTTRGTHEIILGFDFLKRQERILSPRFF